MISVWSDNTQLPRFPSLHGNTKTDVLVIGGGLAGILTAYMLKTSGVDCILAEASTICSGITKNTTAKITAQHGAVYEKLIRQFGEEKAKMYLDANCMAVEKYRILCRDIDCSFEDIDSFVYSTESRKKLEDEADALRRLGVKSDITECRDLPFENAGALKMPHQAQFDPLRFVSALAKDLNILEHTFIREIRDNTAISDKGTIRAKSVVVATHFPFINKHGSYFLKMYQHRSYVTAIENAPTLGGMYVDEAQKGPSLRNYGGLLLVGGGGHRTGKKGGAWRELESFSEKYYPEASEKYRWATQDCMTLDRVPYIGRYSASTQDLYVATGFNKWGMTSSMVSAMILRDMLIGKDNPYSEVFSPSRTMLRRQLPINAFESAINLLTPTAPRCPHLGCALKWNKNERSWDCPCHGSRFTAEGKLIDNPSTGDMTKTGIPEN